MEKATTEEIRLILKMISKGYKVPKIIHDVVFDTAKRDIEEAGKVVIYKRDPNIHSSRAQGAYVKIIEGETLDIHPTAVGGFGADYDGDCVFGSVAITIMYDNCIIERKKVQLKDILELGIFDFYEEKENKKKYKIKKGYGLLIDSINIDTGKCEEKNILGYSIHTNLCMYDIKDKKARFENFWVSSDHSLIIYDEKDNSIKKISPKELLINPKGKFLLRRRVRE